MSAPTNEERWAPRSFSFAVLLFAVGYGALRLANQLAEGRTDWAPLCTLALGVVLVGLIGLGLLRRASAFEHALAALAWAACAAVISVLPAFPSAQNAGSGPLQAPVYLALALLTGLFALGALPGLTLAAPLRGCFLIVFWATADGHAFQRHGETAVPLIAGAALLILSLHARPDSGPRFSGAVRQVFGFAVLLLGWWAVSAAFGDSWRRGAAAIGYLAGGLALACTLASVLDERGTALVVRATLAALLASFALLVAAVLEMIPYNDWVRIAGSRLRLFDKHPNQIAPLFVIGACLLTPLVLRPAGERSPLRAPRWLLALGLLMCIAISVWTRSRGSLLALAVGLAVALLAGYGRVPRRPGRLLAAVTALGALGAAWFASPLAAGLRATLVERTLVQSAFGQRFHLWRSALSAIADNPWLGLGPTQYYVHARYAQPSFLDGNLQDVHPHSILLAAAESAGLPGLLLFCAVALGVLELGRRRVLDAPDAGQRRLLAGVLGAVCGVLLADVADLSQSGLTLMPLTVWIGLGVFAAARPSGSGARQDTRSHEELLAVGPGSHPRLTWAACAVLFAPLAAMPLLGEGLVERARLELSRGAHWRAETLYRVLLRGAHPWNGLAPMGLVSTAVLAGHPEVALQRMDAVRREAPARLAGWLRQGEMLLDAGRPDQALELLDAARSIDPNGKHAGKLTMLRVRALLELGQEQVARELLLDALAEPDPPLSLLPQAELPPQAGDPPGVRRFGFAVAGSPPGAVPYSDLLDALEQQLFEELELDEVRARRLLGPIVEGWRAQHLPRRALDVVLRYREHTHPMASIQVMELDLQAELGDFDAVARAYQASEYIDHPYMTAAYLRCIRVSTDPERRREFRELPLVFSSSKTTDLFFSAELSSRVFVLQAERGLLNGTEDAGREHLERALYHLDSARARIAAAAAYFELATERDTPDADLAAALRILLREANRSPSAARDERRMTAWATSLAATYEGADLSPLLDAAGPAGRTFREAWQVATR